MKRDRKKKKKREGGLKVRGRGEKRNDVVSYTMKGEKLVERKGRHDIIQTLGATNR